jgi:TetR/AcrR family fatty acid metabolism transcriptional regulator
MTIHSVALRTTTVAVRRRPEPPVTGKKDAILRAAIDVFAERGFFNAQVADVARAAGVAAGTVYLYFQSKDDILASIFERTMREAFAEGRTALADVRDPSDRLRAFARLHLARFGRDRNLAIVFQVELRHSIKFMERLSSSLLRDYLGQIRATIVDGQRSGIFREDINATAAAKMFFGALDEMATNWVLSRRRYALADDADQVAELFLTGARRKS